MIVVVSQVFETDGSGGGSCYAAPNFWGPECRYVFIYILVRIFLYNIIPKYKIKGGIWKCADFV